MSRRRILPAMHLVAANTAAASGNPVHTDEGAKAAGYAGAVIGGLTTYGYLCAYPLREWGARWLERGGIDVRLRAPIVDQQPLLLSGEVAGYELRARVDTAPESGRVAPEGLPDPGPPVLAVAWLGGPGALPPWSFPEVPAAPKRPPTLEALAGVTSLPSLTFRPDAAWCSATLTETQLSSADLGVTSGDIVTGDPLPPSLVIDMANLALMNGLNLGAWLHTRSRTQHFTTLLCGDDITVRTRAVSVDQGELGVTAVFEVAFVRKDRVCVRVEHSALFST